MKQETFVLKFQIPDSEAGTRLDRLLTSRLADTSRSYVQRLIESGDVLVNDQASRPSHKVVAGEIVEAHVPPPEQPEELTPADILIPIAYEDDDILVFDKPPGLVVHPAPGHAHGTLLNAFKWLRPDAIPSGSRRPGLIHRLDQNTSGLIVLAKTERARLHLLQQWQGRSVVKQYTALVIGHLSEERAVIDAPIGRDPNNRKRMAVVKTGRPAVTHLQTVTRYAGYSLLDVWIETGRTHQIRVHCSFVNHPVAADTVYGGSAPDLALDRHFLHARRLQFELPDGAPLDLQSPLPDDLASALEQLESRS